MTNNQNNPVNWSLLLYELSGAHEAPGNLFNEMNDDGKIDEVEFRIQLSHIYRHLNTAWNSRNRDSVATDAEHASEALFPNDLNPL